MFNISEFRKQADRLSDLLPWAAMIAPSVILNKDGSFMSVLLFRGPDLESSTEPQLVAACARLNNAFKRLGSGWALFVEARREQAQAYPSQGFFPDPLSLLIDTERRDLFGREQEHYESHYYLTIQYLPPRETVSKANKFFIDNEEGKGEHDYHRSLEFFNTTVSRLYDILKDFMFETQFLTDDALLTYLHRCISFKTHQVNVPDTPMYLDAFLADMPLAGGLAPKLGNYCLRTVSILGFPGSSVPAILDQLNHLPIEYRWVSRYLPLDKIDAEKILKNYRRKWFAKRKGMLSMLTEVFSKSESALVDSASMRKAQDADIAMQELADDHVSYGYYTATVTVWDQDPTVVDDKLREIERVINGLGFTTVAETVNAVDAWLSSLPGHCNANVRMPLIHSLNLAHLVPFSAVWAGPESNAHLGGPPLLYARTTGNTPFRLSNHIGDVGHQMIIGPTGAGKSVLLTLMAMQFLRYRDAQIFVFDKGASFLTATAGIGGHYYDVGSKQGGGLVFQPLAHVDQDSERVWAADWIIGILRSEKIEITPEIKEVVWNALTNLAELPIAQRTITGLKALTQDTKVRLALESYALGGPYGDILDADHEVFYEKNWQCFEMETLMQMPDVVAPVLSYLFHVLEKRFTGRPTLMILDEAWLFLDHPMFAAKIREWLKTLRKHNVAVIFATQSVQDALDNGISAALLESCPSRIFLPNDRALEPNVQKSYIELGLNERQVHILAHAIPKRQYYYDSFQGNALFDLALGDVALAFCAASRPKDKRIVRELLAHYSGQQFVTAYLEKRGLHWAADLLVAADE